MEGQCSCGEVRFEMTDDPLFVHACYCTNCQRQSGSAHALNAMVESHLLNILAGDVEGVTVPTGSGKGQTIFRCPSCKVGLWSHYLGGGDAFSFVRVGTLEDPGAYPPDVNIFTKSKPSWATVLAGIPTTEAFYDRAELWPEASLKRMQAVMDGTT